MKTDIRMYGQEFNSSVIKDLNELNQKIGQEKDPEELLSLRMKRLYRGMEMNTPIYKRDYRTFFPY